MNAISRHETIINFAKFQSAFKVNDRYLCVSVRFFKAFCEFSGSLHIVYACYTAAVAEHHEGV